MNCLVIVSMTAMAIVFFLPFKWALDSKIFPLQTEEVMRICAFEKIGHSSFVTFIVCLILLQQTTKLCQEKNFQKHKHIVSNLILSSKMLLNNKTKVFILHRTRQILERTRDTTGLSNVANSNPVFVATHWDVQPCPGWLVSCLPTGKRFTHQTVQHPHIQTHTSTNRNTHQL